MYHLLRIKDLLHLLLSATFWYFSFIFIRTGQNSFQQCCSEVAVAQFWCCCHSYIGFLLLSLWIDAVKVLRTSYAITFYHPRGASVGKVDAFAISALTLLLPSGVLDILNKESPPRSIHGQERYNYGAGLYMMRVEKQGKWRGTFQSISTRMFLWFVSEEGETGRTQLLSFSIAAVLCSLPKGGMVYGWEYAWRLLPSRIPLADISSNSIFSHFTQHFLSVSKQTNNNSNFLHLAKRKQNRETEAFLSTHFTLHSWSEPGLLW